MYKFEVKRRYKDLVRQGFQEEAEKVLDELRFYSRNGHFSNEIKQTLDKSSKVSNQPKAEQAKPKDQSDGKYDKKYLSSLDFDELRDVGYKVGAKGRSKKGLIKDILAIQSGKKEPEIE